MYNKIILKKSSIPAKVPVPSDLVYGELALNYADGVLYYKNAANEISSISGGGGGSSVTVSATAPTSPSEGDLWWDTETGVLFIYYNDGSSSQWVETTPQLLAEGPTGTYTLTGNFAVTGDTTIQGTLFETSDEKLKKNIHRVDNALDTVKKLRGVEFVWVKNDKPSMGLIAQEVEQVIPYLVQEDLNGTKTINYTALIGGLIESIKELDAKVEQLQKKKSVWDKVKGWFNGN